MRWWRAANHLNAGGLTGYRNEDYTRPNAIDKDVEREKYALPRPAESVGHRLKAHAGTERGSRPGVVPLKQQ